ncbi:hypothetical protein [Altererythrobacter sp. GH1-8]|uniref:hypothetical protein n=1 Tax=Altererythrobacter sp. GH1-8 TaxID=3349333 RepID=UPI00374DED84
MSEGALLSITVLIGWLILAGSALASYRLNWSKAAQMALTWFAIFAGLFMLFRFFGL